MKIERWRWGLQLNAPELTENCVCVYPHGNNQRTGRPANNGPAPQNSIVLWEPSAWGSWERRRLWGGVPLFLLEDGDNGCGWCWLGFFFFLRRSKPTSWVDRLETCSLCCRNNRSVCLLEGHCIPLLNNHHLDTHTHLCREYKSSSTGSCVPNAVYTLAKGWPQTYQGSRICEISGASWLP